MKFFYLIALYSFLISSSSFAQNQTLKEGEITITSDKKNINTPCSEFNSTIDLTEKTVTFTVPMANFFFDSKLQKNHWTNKIFDTDNFPNATFIGTITSTEDLTQDGSYKVVVTGKLKIKDVEQDLTAEGTITKKGKSTTAISTFLVDRKSFGVPGMGTDDQIQVTVITNY